MAPKAKAIASGANITIQPRIFGLQGHGVAEDRQQRLGGADRPGHTTVTTIATDISP
jgi:hypothetical protein